MDGFFHRQLESKFPEAGAFAAASLVSLDKPAVYYVRRKKKIKGPLTVAKLHRLHDDGRLRGSDEIAEDRDGPWQLVADAAADLLGLEIPIVDESPPRPFRQPPSVRGRDDDEKTPWDVLNSSPVRIGAALAIAATILLVLFLTSSGEPEAVPVAQQPAAALPANPEPARPAAVQPVEPKQKLPQPAAVGATERQAIERLLTNFYNAPSWKQRYACVVADDPQAKLIEQLYKAGRGRGVKSVAITKLPSGQELKASRDAGAEICVELQVDERPTAVFVVYEVLDGWKIEWTKTLEELWLGK